MGLSSAECCELWRHRTVAPRQWRHRVAQVDQLVGVDDRTHRGDPIVERVGGQHADEATLAVEHQNAYPAVDRSSNEMCADPVVRLDDRRQHPRHSRSPEDGTGQPATHPSTVAVEGDVFCQQRHQVIELTVACGSEEALDELGVAPGICVVPAPALADMTARPDEYL